MGRKLYDIAGQRFGMLTVIERAPDRVHHGALWRCVCDCGNETIAGGRNIRTGNTKSCGCLKVADQPRRQLDLTGRVFGRLTALEMEPRNGRRGNRVWVCRCSCGNTKSVRADKLVPGITISCGCAVAGPFIVTRPQEVRDHAAQHDRRGLGIIPAHEIEALYARQKGRCPYCSADLSDGYHKDHVIPLSRGGEHSIKNTQLLCIPCNRKKYNKMPWDFAQEIGLLV